MSNYSNTSSINLNSGNSQTTDQYFNNFYDKNSYDISSTLNDQIIGHFQLITDTPEAAKSLASAVIYTAISQGLDPLSVLDQFKKKTKEELSLSTAVFLNLDRYGTSFVGYTNNPYINKYVERMIRA